MFNSGFKSVAYFPFSVLLWLSKAEVLKHFAWARKFLQYSVFSLERIKSHKLCTRASCLQSVSPGYIPKSGKKISAVYGCLIPRINCSDFHHYLLALLQIFFSKFI